MIDIVITSMGKKVEGKDETYLEQCLKSIDQYATEDYQLILVENASPYAKAVNLGLALSENDVLLLNDDIVMTEGWERIKGGVGDIRGFKLLYPSYRVIQHAGGFLDARFNGKHHAQYAWDTHQCMAAFPCHFVTFGAAYIRKKVIEAVGPLKQFSTIFFEDVDYCLRAWNMGFTVFYNPISAFHYERATMGNDDSIIKPAYEEAHARFVERWGKDETLSMLDERMKNAWEDIYGTKKPS